MKRITLNITDKQYAALKDRARVTGVPQSEQIRRVLDIDIAVFIGHRDSILALLEKEPYLEKYFPGYLPEQKSSTECETLLSLNQAQEIAQKLGKPIDELYERVPAQKSSAEVQLFTDRKASA